MADEMERTSAPRRVRRTVKTAATPDTATEQEAVARDPEQSASAAARSKLRLRRGGVREADITNFLRQLILMLEAGTPILRSLKTLSQRGERASVRALVGDIAEYVEMGNPLWQAFDRHPQYFDTVFVNLIKAAEASGQLTGVLRRVVEYRENRELLAKRVRSAALYPVILIVMALGVLLLLSQLVIPTFEEVYEKQDIALEGFPMYFLESLKWYGSYGWWITLLVIAAVVLIYKGWYVRDPRRRLTADRIKISLPVVGGIAHKHALTELARTMALLLRSGVSMMSTLELTRAAIHNRAVADSLQGVRDSVERGGGLEEPMRAAEPVIPPVVTDMFVTGEESGRVDQIADQLANAYEEDVKIAVDNIGTLIQPILVVFIGVLVVMLFMGLFLPMLEMIDQLNAGA